MPTIAHVLCPVDLSDVSRLALQYAVSIGAAEGVPLRVIQVVDSGLPPMSSGPQVYELPAEVRTQCEDELNWFAAPVLREEVTTEVVLREGKVVPAILEEARSLVDPLLVIGTHGRSGFERFALGSVADKVLRRASCPVLAIPPDSAPPAGGFRRILCAIDFSEPSTEALAFAEHIGRANSANLILVHVLEWPFGDTTGPDPVTTLRQNLEAEAADQLAGLAAGRRVAERIVQRGKPSREIVDVARSRGADLIVIGVAGRGAIDLALLGSTARQVLHEAPCPVLTVPVRSTDQ